VERNETTAGLDHSPPEETENRKSQNDDPAVGQSAEWQSAREKTVESQHRRSSTHHKKSHATRVHVASWQQQQNVTAVRSFVGGRRPASCMTTWLRCAPAMSLTGTAR
jgi:hypothetical protein